ncbi:hypothetical protein [Marinobacter shengliensis]|uniref:hypothetical protein n=1 Tax=Marinobacter shengliensis TaxID=1389223 RepID=UPI001E3753DC|nr:hypothetical protein [Marinobacter shengliensis]MCD1628508.1 hypothetical protein [Marinobacter shengliensis]
MSQFTDQQVRSLMVYVDPEQLSGNTPQRFLQIEKITGLPVERIFEYYANNGYAWADAAEFVGVNPNTLSVYCHNMGLKFNWQGVRSNQSKIRHSRLMKGTPSKRALIYQAFGIRAPLKELVSRFSPEGINPKAVRRRLERGYKLEEALTLPKGEPWRPLQKAS